MSAGRPAWLLCAASLSLGCVEQGFPSAPYGAPYAPPFSAGMGAAPPLQYPYPYASPYALAAPPAWGPAPGSAATAVAYAQSRLGTPYCWGGTGPRCFDCSGLTRAAWAAGGRAIPRTSEAQVEALTPVAPQAVQPGDILWRPGHVGLYVGQGWAIAATHTGDFVRYQRADGFVRAVRP